MEDIAGGSALIEAAFGRLMQKGYVAVELGTFSVSLGVKDMDRSMDFYKKFGFEVIDGGHMNEEYADTDTEKWRILQNGTTNIGLFQGMFDVNILTFNPKDLRPIQREPERAERRVRL